MFGEQYEIVINLLHKQITEERLTTAKIIQSRNLYAKKEYVNKPV